MQPLQLGGLCYYGSFILLSRTNPYAKAATPTALPTPIIAKTNVKPFPSSDAKMGKKTR